jgi:hypothetical protein
MLSFEDPDGVQLELTAPIAPIAQPARAADVPAVPA